MAYLHDTPHSPGGGEHLPTATQRVILVLGSKSGTGSSKLVSLSGIAYLIS